MAARGAGAAARADAAHRRAHEPGRGRSGRTGPHRGVPAGAAGIGLDRSAATCGSTIAGARAMPTAFANTRRNWSRSRRTSSWPGSATVAAAAAGNPHRADRVRARRRSGRRRLRRQPGAAGRQRHRFHQYSNTASSGKWLELLKEIAPRVTRAAVIRDPAIAAGIGQFAAIQAVAPSLGMEVSPVNVRDAGRDRARRHGIRARAEWRPDRDGGARWRSFIAI